MSEVKKDYELENDVTDDFSLDDIEDMPGFITPPTGAYVVVTEKGIEDKDISDEAYFNVSFTIKAVEDVAESALDDEETMPKEGDMFSMLYKKNNKFALDNFKKSLGGAIRDKFGVTKMGDIKERSVGLEMLMLVKRRYNKKADRHNIEVKRVAIL